MRTRYLFFDYDGTLRSRAQDRVPESAERALQVLRANGHRIALATGRLQCNALELAAPYGIDDLVADGGNSVTIAGELRWIEGMPLDPCRRLLHWLDDNGWYWAVMTGNEFVRYSRFPDFSDKLPDTYMRTIAVSALDIDSLDPIYKIFIPCEAGRETAIPFGGVTWARYSPLSIYCEPTDKSVGIRRMMAEFDAPPSDAIVFGDGSNDLAMFCPDWTCVAMGNAIDALKIRADLVTTDIDDDGVWNACRALGLI